MLLGPGAMTGLLWRAGVEIKEKPIQETFIFWAIILVIFLPIALGLSIFGWYAWKGYYGQLPESSAEVE